MESKQLLALRRAVDKAGGQSALARACGIKQGHVWHWLNKSLRVPAEHVLAVEAATDGSVTRHELRPDIFGKERDSLQAPASAQGAPAGRVAAEVATQFKPGIAEQIAALEAKQHRAVRETLLHQKGAAERLAKLDKAIAALRDLADGDR